MGFNSGFKGLIPTGIFYWMCDEPSKCIIKQETCLFEEHFCLICSVICMNILQHSGTWRRALGGGGEGVDMRRRFDETCWLREPSTLNLTLLCCVTLRSLGAEGATRNNRLHLRPWRWRKCLDPKHYIVTLKAAVRTVCPHKVSYVANTFRIGEFLLNCVGRLSSSMWRRLAW